MPQTADRPGAGWASKMSSGEGFSPPGPTGYRLYPIEPMAKPRQTRKDKWNPGPEVLRYRSWADEVRLRGIAVQPGDRITFVVPMPRSWSRTKRSLSVLTPHKSVPDVDNLLKALLDAVLPGGDQAYWCCTIRKLWGWQGAIVVEPGPSLLIEPGLVDLLLHDDGDRDTTLPAKGTDGARGQGRATRQASAKGSGAGAHGTREPAAERG